MHIIDHTNAAYLLLSDGTVFKGLSVGAKGTTVGEVVFTTGMTGYQETLSDPSYYGQIVTQTFPLVGNYGTNSVDFESGGIHVKGYIVREWCEVPSNFRMEGDLDAFLKKHQVVGLYNIDTRALTRKLREHGVMNGMITTENVYENMEKHLEQINGYQIIDAIESVSCKEKQTFCSEKQLYRVALMDYGYKYNIKRSLIERGCDVTLLPHNTTAEEVARLNFDGIMLSNGPGDPSENKQVIENLREILKLGKPVFGICLGHQLVALAMGGKTSKLKYGHRGTNQPVTDLVAGRTYVTSQNHGYAVEGDSIPNAVGCVTHINSNDKTCEGVYYKSYKAYTVQFHPEACGGPADTSYLFDQFVSILKANKEGK